MSSILKALKKLENDKSICKMEQLRIDSKILQDASSTNFSGPTLFLIAIVLFICGGGATFLYMKHDTSIGIVSHTSYPQTERQNTSPTIPPVLKRETLKTRSVLTLTPGAPPAVEVRMHVPDNNITSKKMQQSLRENKAVVTTLTQAPPVEPTQDPKTTASKKSIPIPVLIVNGIAVQDGGNDNLAVINGMTVSSGSIIEGVTVEEIQKDRVHFSQGGEKFEIILNKSNR